MTRASLCSACLVLCQLSYAAGVPATGFEPATSTLKGLYAARVRARVIVCRRGERAGLAQVAEAGITRQLNRLMFVCFCR